ncbi:ESPR-type extended signal peptide-containing protein [uncultured Phascolarctobacterium sp.]|uniref:ESPR-type extended signal peptide-containing protein n=1 Tax=uncultured Phascolarctobacterium sp. TaxID=512296 RepID=UPI0025EB71E2|nr:ESPR-type extended signal peptide-containing protein [uncultured Phascolarctobacterium sp.]
MNKVFKVIWSEARNAYVVVSEIAKNHGSKSCSTKKLLAMLIATGVMTCASMAPAMAADPPAEALKHNTVAAGYNTTVTTKDNSDGGKEYNVDLKNDILLSGDNDAFVNISGSNGSVWASSSVAAGNVIMDGTTATVSGLGNTTTAYDGFANGEGKAATEEQLKEISKVAENANQGWNLSTNGGEASKVAPGETVDFSGDKNINISNDGTNVKVKLNDDIDVKSVQTNVLNAKYNLSVGTANETGTVPFFVNSNGAFYAANGKLVVDKDGKLVAPEAELGKVTADEGEIGNVVLKDGVFYKNTALRDGELYVGDADGNYSQITTKGAKLGKVTVAADGKISGVAAGAVTADSTDAVNGSQLHAVATEAGKHSKVVSGNNINVEETDVDGQKFYKVNMNKDIMLGDLTGKNVSISGTNGTIETTGYIATKDRVYADKGAKLADIDVTGNKISNGASSIVLDGSNVKVNDKVTIDQNGNIAGVADGDVKENSKDAVNGSQLYKTNQEVVNNTNRINQLGSRVNKVGAGAAALAALHPMDFDPDDKLTFSAGYGNYGGENAAAIGAYYRPDEKVMFSIGGTVGNGENMVNAGVSFSLDRTNHVSNSRTAMAREILDLRAEVTELKAMVAKGGLGSIAEDKMKIFPDVAENHWAYEYVGKLAAAGIIEGYPDGKFSGDRMMSRYEFAAMLYRAMQKGAQLDSKIINEFAPEMGRIRVDRISGEDGDRDKIERVRVNDTKGERDHYGNKLAK